MRVGSVEGDDLVADSDLALADDALVGLVHSGGQLLDYVVNALEDLLDLSGFEVGLRPILLQQITVAHDSDLSLHQAQRFLLVLAMAQFAAALGHLDAELVDALAEDFRRFHARFDPGAANEFNRLHEGVLRVLE